MKKMKELKAFRNGDGAHCGLSDWYEDGEAELNAALDAHEPFDTGWYSSKKEIATARIRSEDGVTIKIDVSVSDDFDTEGSGYMSITEWTLDAVAQAIAQAWNKAEQDQDDNAPYTGFALMHNGRCIEYYILGNGEFDTPPGDHYHWWGWQHDELDGQGLPPPDLPLPAAAAFENWARQWAYGETKDAQLQIGAWSLQPWDRACPFVGEAELSPREMGWVGQDGRP